MGYEISPDQPALATSRGEGHPVFRLHDRNPEGDLHNQRHRIDEQLAEESAQNQGFIPERQTAHQTDLPGDEEDRKKVDDAKPQRGQ